MQLSTLVFILRLSILAVICRFVLVVSTSHDSKTTTTTTNNANSRASDVAVSSITIIETSTLQVLIPPIRGGASSSQQQSISGITDERNDQNQHRIDEDERQVVTIVDRVEENEENRDVSVNISTSVLAKKGKRSTIEESPGILMGIEKEDGEEDTEGEFNQNRFTRRRQQFFNRIAKVSSLMLRREHDASLEEEEEHQVDADVNDDLWGNEITPQSDLTRPGRHVHIVTTAALPWFTGTAVNPLLRAAYLHERLEQINSDHASTSATSNTIKSIDNSTGSSNITTENNNITAPSSYVTLVIPWLELPEDQRQLYNGQVFKSPQEQELYVRNWLRDHANMPNAAQKLNLVFYNARYHAGLCSVFAMGDIIQQLQSSQQYNVLDVCILEEPEHVNWFRAPGQGWTKRYNYVVGIVHTNYDMYATQHYSGLWTAPAIRLMSAAMIRAYCHKVIKLSDVVQIFAPEKEVTTNVHGVRQEFIAPPNEQLIFEKGPNRTVGYNNKKNNHTHEQAQVYFIGKLLWTKGLDILLELEEYFKEITGEYFAVDIYGSGPDQEEISRAYLGRRTLLQENKKNTNNLNVEEVSRNLFGRFFAWINRRRFHFRRKKHNRPVTTDDIYKDVMEVIEALPIKARTSLEEFPSQTRDTLDQWTDDMAKAQKTVKRLPTKARRALNHLVDDLSKVPIPRSLYELRRQPIPAIFPGRVDHAELKHSHKIFVNPSISEVLCTTTAEALAMGKFVIIPVHASNQFFLKFPNCLAYRNSYEFVANLRWALTHDPVPMTEDLAREFTWEAATDRFIQSAAITHREAIAREILGRSKMDERIAWFHNELGKGVKGDIIRKAFGAGPVSGQVKYELLKGKQGPSDEGFDEEEVDEEDTEDEGLSRKFHDTAFVKALREAFENGITTTIE